MTLPRTDTLKPRPRLGIPTRSLAATKPVAGTVDAALIQGIPVSTIAPTAKQVVMYDAALGDYVPTTIGEISSGGSEVIISGEAQALRKGPSYVVFGTGALASGDVVIGPSGIQRMEVLTIPRVGASVAYPNSPTLGNTLNATQTNVTLSATGPTNGQHILIDNEAMLVQSGGGTTSLVVSRGRLQTAGASHSIGQPVLRVSVQAVVDVQGGLRATGGIATSDFALYGSSTQELLVVAKYTPTPPTATYVGNPDGDMHLHLGQHNHSANTNYRVEIDTQGAPGQGATFRWSDDGGGSWDASLVACSQSLTHLQNGVYISWDFGTYQVGTRFDWTAIGTANQVELIRADTTADTLHLRHVDLSAVSSVHESILLGTFEYTGTSTNNIIYGFLSLAFSNGSAAAQSGQCLSLTTYAKRGGGTLSTVGIVIQPVSGAEQTAPYTKHANIWMNGTSFDGIAAATMYGLEIANLGFTGITTSAALRIDAQSGATTTYNIWQAGTTGVNRLAAPTLIGADASPAAGLSLEVTGDAAVSSQLHVGASTVPAAGVALQLTGGYLKMAASANNYIADSAGTRILTLASDATLNASVATFAGDLRVNDILGVGGAATGARLRVLTWTVLGAGTHRMIQVDLAGQQTANATAKYGFGFVGPIDLGGFNVGLIAGVSSYPDVLDNVAGTSVLTNYAMFDGGLMAGSGGPLAGITNSAVYWAAAPNLTNTTPVTNHAGLLVKNQGDGNIVNAVGVDIEAQSGASGLNIGLRNAGTSLLVGEVEMDGALNHDGANVGFYGTAPATQQTPTGSRGGNAALASLLTALALTGIIVDGTS